MDDVECGYHINGIFGEHYIWRMKLKKQDWRKIKLAINPLAPI